MMVCQNNSGFNNRKQIRFRSEAIKKLLGTQKDGSISGSSEIN